PRLNERRGVWRTAFRQLPHSGGERPAWTRRLQEADGGLQHRAPRQHRALAGVRALCVQQGARACIDPPAVRPSAVRVSGPAMEIRRHGDQARRRAASALPRSSQCRPRFALRLRNRRCQGSLQPGGLGSGGGTGPAHGRQGRWRGELGGRGHGALPRLDDRRGLDRNPQESHRRAPVRPPVRSAPAQAGRGGGVICTVAPPKLTNSNLRDALFSPRSVAIVGQSDDAAKAAGRPLKFLRRIGYAVRVDAINPRRDTVLGERAWPALAALPEPPEHAYIVTPTEAAVAAVEECGALGVKVATVLADGFAEAGDEGMAREARLRETCARTGIRLVG